MNPELRAVLTEALSEALKRLWTDPEDAADQADWDALPGKLADAVASLPGVAVIQLPEPCNPLSEWHSHCLGAWPTGFNEDPVSAWPDPEVIASPDGEMMSPERARGYAAALLAAAAAAVVAR
ncbi:hypothetical protein KBG_62 [Mycobacterium phage KBG]|uniref:Uncharacterized protein n=1 Tax=Mycobacterium phage KBG TaxID=2914011 RepID=B3VG33_9CAUD|nr:hypothetical protein KBG_62 [Mycobacterium phage KBG]ACE79810.1 hypothetical protein KBG_62 [Mycobacterium phage KBG]